MNWRCLTSSMGSLQPEAVPCYRTLRLPRKAPGGSLRSEIAFAENRRLHRLVADSHSGSVQHGRRCGRVPGRAAQQPACTPWHIAARATTWIAFACLLTLVKRPNLRRGHLTLRFTAEAFPRFSSISYSICCPSLSVLSPARSTAEM